MYLIGDALSKPGIAAEYIQYFKGTVRRVTNVVSRIPKDHRPKVLYSNLKRLTQEQLIESGGLKLRWHQCDERWAERGSASFSIEQMFTWDPDILIVASSEDLEEARQDPRLGKLRAVASNKVFLAPMGAHLWANRTVEQPLTLLWAAQIIMSVHNPDHAFFSATHAAVMRVGRSVSFGDPNAVITAESLSDLYSAPISVLTAAVPEDPGRERKICMPLV
jgi:ABC-type Fe3+-hydroxamate transport system substrate-binding protein